MCLHLHPEVQLHELVLHTFWNVSNKMLFKTVCIYRIFFCSLTITKIKCCTMCCNIPQQINVSNIKFRNFWAETDLFEGILTVKVRRFPLTKAGHSRTNSKYLVWLLVDGSTHKSIIQEINGMALGPSRMKWRVEYTFKALMQ